MKNFAFTYDGKELWYSRSLAVSCLVYTVNPFDNRIYILANKRGSGCEFNRGLWNAPGGFIDFDETAEEACTRECFEETGVSIPLNGWKLVELDTKPNKTRQTMVARYVTFTNWNRNEEFSMEYSEPNEVEEIKWIAIDDLDQYEWSNRQKEAIIKHIKEIQL